MAVAGPRADQMVHGAPAVAMLEAVRGLLTKGGPEAVKYVVTNNIRAGSEKTNNSRTNKMRKG